MINLDPAHSFMPLVAQAGSEPSWAFKLPVSAGNLTGKNVTFRLVNRVSGAIIAEENAVITDGPAREIRVDLQEADTLTPGAHLLTIRVDDDGDVSVYPERPLEVRIVGPAPSDRIEFVEQQAITAVEAKNTATAQAAIATTQAGIAAEKAGIATTKAGEAATSAETAQSAAATAAQDAADGVAEHLEGVRLETEGLRDETAGLRTETKGYRDQAAASEGLATARATALNVATPITYLVHSQAELDALSPSEGETAHNTADGNLYRWEMDAWVWKEQLAIVAASSVEAAASRAGGPGAVLPIRGVGYTSWADTDPEDGRQAFPASNGLWVLESDWLFGRGGYVYDARQFGVVGDGETDDTDAWLELLDRVATDGGGMIGHAGMSLISEPLLLPDRTMLLGNGRSTGFITSNPTLGLHNGILTIDTEDVIVANLFVDGARNSDQLNPGRSAGVALRPDSRRCGLYRLWTARCMRHGVIVTGEDHTIQQLHTWDNVAYGISFGNGALAINATRHIRVRDLWTRDSQQRFGVEVNDGVHDLRVDGFYCGKAAPGYGGVTIWDHERPDEANTNIHFSRGYIDISEQGDYGIRVSSTTEGNRHEDISFTDIFIRGGVQNSVFLRGNIKGIELNNVRGKHCGRELVRIVPVSAADLRPQDITFNGGRFSENDGPTPTKAHGVEIDRARGVRFNGTIIEKTQVSGVQVLNSDYVTLDGVTVKETGLHETGTRHGVFTQVTDDQDHVGLKIINSTIRDNTNNAGALGIRHDARYVDAIYAENHLANNAGGNIGGQALPRTVIVRNNQGYRTENGGTHTLGSAETQSANINHGLPFTPEARDIKIWPVGNPGSATKWWVTPGDINSVRFRINVDAAPGADVEFAWEITRL